MGKLDAKFEQFKQAMEKLRSVLEKEKNEYMRDSAIKRFEICFDLSWKLIKAFLEEKKGVICASPKTCFREAYNNDLLNYDEFWLEITDLRNELSHIYRETAADNAYAKMPKILEYLEALEEGIEKEMSDKSEG